MPAKTAPKTKGSNIAKSTLNLKTKFNPKLLIAIILVIVATLGFIYIFFSKAGSEQQYLYDLESATPNNVTMRITKIGYENKELKKVTLPNSNTFFKACDQGGSSTPSYMISNEKAKKILIISNRCASDASTKNIVIPIFDTVQQNFSGNLTISVPFDEQAFYAIDAAKQRLYVHTNTRIQAYDLTTRAFINAWDAPRRIDNLEISSDGTIVTAFFADSSFDYNAISYNYTGTELIRKKLAQTPAKWAASELQNPGQGGAISGTDDSFILAQESYQVVNGYEESTVVLARLNHRTLETQTLPVTSQLGPLKHTLGNSVQVRAFGGVSGRVYLVAPECVSANNVACSSYQRLDLTTMKSTSFGQAINATTRISGFTESMDNLETLYVEHQQFTRTTVYRARIDGTLPTRSENIWNSDISRLLIMAGSVIPESTTTTTTTPSTTGTTTPTPTGTTVAPPPSGNTTN